jgi:hypothetical protein
MAWMNATNGGSSVKPTSWSQHCALALRLLIGALTGEEKSDVENPLRRPREGLNRRGDGYGILERQGVVHRAFSLRFNELWVPEQDFGYS